jgi:hypothetical protein
MQKTMKSLVGLAIGALSLSAVGAHADVVTLKVEWETAATGTNQFGSTNLEVALSPKSPRIKLGANQTGKVLHFYCVQTNDYISGLGFISHRGLNDAVQLKVDFGDIAVSYYQGTLTGGISSSGTHLPGAGLPALVGPATLELLPGDVPGKDTLRAVTRTAGMAICTVEVSGTAEVLPGDTVVQSPQANPVEVKLETSLATEAAWQPANLGRYDATDQKRFFRLRIDKVE